MAEEAGHGEALYLAQGGFMGTNGNCAAGILDVVARDHPESVTWMGFETNEQAGHPT